MTWVVWGVVYSTVYAVVAVALAAHPVARLWAGNLGLLVSPLVPIVVILRRRRDWGGRQLAFWDAIGVGAVLWLVGQVAWANHELLLDRHLPWLDWDIVPQLSGSLMPLFALIAWPHAGQRRESAATAVLDIYGFVFLSAFLIWSLVVAPGLTPGVPNFSVHLLAILGPTCRAVVIVGLLFAVRSTDHAGWRQAYGRLAAGATTSFVFLSILSPSVIGGTYQTGSPLDVGWILPFWFYAWAAADAPRAEVEPRRSIADSGRPSPPTVLFVALIAVPVLGYAIRHFLPAGNPADHYRGVAIALALTGGLVLVMLRVIVEHRALESADRRLRLLASALEQSDELIVIVRGSTIRYANDAFCRAFGYTLRELVSVPAANLVAEVSRQSLVEVNETIRQRRAARATATLKRKDGSTFQGAFTAALLNEPSGGPSHMLGVVRDLSDEIRLQDQLVRSERLSAIGELVSGVAHEINNPLQSVIGNLELVMAARHDPAVMEDLERVRWEAARAGRIIRNLLAFVRKSPNERLLADLNEIVQGTVSLRAYELGNAGIELREHYTPNLPLVLVNREEIQQVVLNLVINAHQSMVDVEGTATLTISTHACGPDAVLEVADNGPGIPAEMAGRVFEPFFTTKGIGEGSGLGLSIAFGIASAHNGTLELVPSERGARFRLALPGACFPGPAHIH